MRVETVVVTRHQALVTLLIERGIVPACSPATPCAVCAALDAAHLTPGEASLAGKYDQCIGMPVPVISHATSADVRGKHVIGVLPLALACEARMVTEIPLALLPEDRGHQLTIERMREVAGAARTYEVRDLNAIPPMHLRPLPAPEARIGG